MSVEQYTRVCCDCNSEKPITQFRRAKGANGKFYHRHRCLVCERKTKLARYYAGPVAILDEPPPLPTQENAEVRAVPGYVGYAISDHGAVWSCRVAGPTNKFAGSWKKCRRRVCQTGYLIVTLQGPDGPTHQKVHRLLMFAFIGPCPRDMEARHLNGIRDDCRLDNLAWGTQSDNTMDRFTHGTGLCNETHPSAKLTNSQVVAIRERVGAGEGVCAMAREYNVTPGNISAIVHYKSWRHLDD